MCVEKRTDEARVRGALIREALSRKPGAPGKTGRRRGFWADPAGVGTCGLVVLGKLLEGMADSFRQPAQPPGSRSRKRGAQSQEALFSEPELPPRPVGRGGGNGMPAKRYLPWNFGARFSMNEAMVSARSSEGRIMALRAATYSRPSAMLLPLQ